jgi:hypothetical protein
MFGGQNFNPFVGMSEVEIAGTVALLVWSLIWKGISLWKAAGLRHKPWFIALLIINSFGLLDIIYIYFVARKYKVEVIEK